LTNIYKDIDELNENIDSGVNFMEKIKDKLNKLIKVDKSVTIKKNRMDGHYFYLTKSRYAILEKAFASLEHIVVDGKTIKIKDFDIRLIKNAVKIKYAIAEKSKSLVNCSDQLAMLTKKYYVLHLFKLYQKYNNMFKYFDSVVSFVDYLKTGAKTAKLYNYFRPTFVDGIKCGYIKCKNLRHPIVERIIEHEYVPHDIELGGDLKGMLIYGLNSAGKSILMKAVGLSIIMAQAGFYVPAEKFEYSPYKSLFTRITGNDNLFRGLSSFGLEMTELEAIMKRANNYTLVIGDEVCRGTEHISGNCIVAGSLIRLSERNASFIFATHLHELIKLRRIKNASNIAAYHLSVEHDKNTNTLIYDRLLKEGSGDSIYGITAMSHVVNDKEFVDLVLSFKNELLQSHNTVIPVKKSRYNSEVLVYKCQVCGKRDLDAEMSALQTHHINFQKDCENGFSKEKPHIKMNSKANLAVVCETCHNNIHNNKLSVTGYVSTSSGKLLKVQQL
jgi:DNA mismatch repair protein MutS